MTLPYAEVIGDPIEQSKSPLIHGFWLEKLGIAAEYRKCHVLPEGLADYFAQRRGDAAWRGCNITIPHKQTALPFAECIEERAASVGAINCVYRSGRDDLVGSNSDVDGVCAAIAGVDLGEGDPVVIGSGGAARAAFRALADGGADRVRVVSRQIDKAVAVTREFDLEGIGVPLCVSADALAEAPLLINASPMGMTGQPELPRELLSGVAMMAPDALVFDMVYAPLDTELLQVAREAGLTTSDGLTMLIAQAAAAFELFFDAQPPRQHDDELRRILTV